MYLKTIKTHLASELPKVTKAAASQFYLQGTLSLTESQSQW